MIKVIPAFLVVEKPQKKSKNWHEYKQNFGQIMGKGTYEFFNNFALGIIFFNDLDFFIHPITEIR
jgi:hypothetical protein